MWMENKNDKYMFRESYIDPLTEKKKIVSVTMKSKSRASQKQAKIILSEKIEERLSKLNGSNIITGQTIEKCIQEWLPEYQQLVKPNTYSSTINTFIPFFRKHFDFNIIINNLTAEYISKTFEDIQFSNQYAISTVKQLFAKTCVFLKWCVKHSYLNKDVINNIDIQWKKSGPVKITDKFLEQNELNMVLKYTWQKNKSYGALLEWLYQTGMRIGEAVALKWSDIEIIDDIYIAHIVGTLEYLHKRPIKSNSTKTASGMRDIELSNRAVEILNFLKKYQNDSEFIFKSQSGTPILPNSINLFLRKAKKELEINKPLTTHIFRHTHISKLAELGVPLYVIQQRVGHSTGKVTEQIYLHVTKKAKRKLVNKLDEL